MLSGIEKHIADGDRHIEAQRLRVSTMEANGHEGYARARAFLNGMIESQSVSIKYRDFVVKEIERNRLLDR